MGLARKLATSSFSPKYHSTTSPLVYVLDGGTGVTAELGRKKTVVEAQAVAHNPRVLGAHFGRAKSNSAQRPLRRPTAAPRRFLDSPHRGNHRCDSSGGPVRGLRFLFGWRHGNLESILQSSSGNTS